MFAFFPYQEETVEFRNVSMGFSLRNLNSDLAQPLTSCIISGKLFDLSDSHRTVVKIK